MDIRSKVNPVLMKVQNIQQSLPQIDTISAEFLERLSLEDLKKYNLISNQFCFLFL